MIDLTRDPGTRCSVEKELNQAGIEIIRNEASLTFREAIPICGRLGQFRFTRVWYYWVVLGKVPLKVATELYKNEIGKSDIRVVGNFGCPPPKEWASWFDDQGVQLVNIREMNKIEKLCIKYNNPLPVGLRGVLKKDLSKLGKPFITSYHIDTQIGLNIFVRTLKKYNLF